MYRFASLLLLAHTYAAARLPLDSTFCFTFSFLLYSCFESTTDFVVIFTLRYFWLLLCHILFPFFAIIILFYSHTHFLVYKCVWVFHCGTMLLFISFLIFLLSKAVIYFRFCVWIFLYLKNKHCCGILCTSAPGFVCFLLCFSYNASRNFFRLY